jgi:hypothetical protein
MGCEMIIERIMFILPDLFFRLLFYRHVYWEFSVERNYEIVSDAAKWCEEIMPGRSMILCTGNCDTSFGMVSYYNFCFKSKEDLMAFKLVWYDEVKN